MKTDTTKIKAIVALLVSSIIIGCSYVILKIGLQYASPFAVLCDRLLIAAFVIYILKKTGHIKIDKISNSQKIKLFLLSTLYPSAFFLFQNVGMVYITASEASIIHGLAPILTTIASTILLREKASGLQKVGILLSFGGIAFISFHSFNGFSDTVYGYILLFCSLLSIVFYYIFLKKFVKKISPVSITYYLVLFAVIPSLIVHLATALGSNQILPDFHRLANIKYLMTVLFLGILATLCTSVLISIGIKNLSAIQTSIFSNISPFFGILAGVLVMGDVLQSYQIIGAMCIFTGMFISLKFTIKNKTL